MYGQVQRKIIAIMILIICMAQTIGVLGAPVYKITTHNAVFTINGSTDEAQYLINYSFTNNDTNLYLGNTVYESITGLRFNNVNIPKTATITEVSLELYVHALNPGSQFFPSFTTIYGIKSNNCSTFTNQSVLTNEPYTSSFGMASYWGSYVTSGQWENKTSTPPGGYGLTYIITEIINQAGWVSGNSIGLLLLQNIMQNAKSFRTYNYGSHSYAPKLYITYTTQTEITDNNPWDSINNIIADSKRIIGEKNGYIIWEVMNYTYINANFVYDYTHKIYKLNNGTAWNNIASSTGIPDNNPRKCVDAYNGTLYAFLPITGTDYNLWLYKSTDAGKTWSQLIEVYHNAYTTISTSIDIAKGIGVIYCSYLRSAHPYYKTYNIATSTLSSEVALTYGSTNTPLTIEMLVSSKANWRVAVYGGRGSAGSGYIAYWVNATSTWNYLGIDSSATYNRENVKLALHEGNNELCHAYFAATIAYPYVGVQDLYMDSDYSYTRGSILGQSDNIYDVNFEGDCSHIIVTGLSYNGAYPSFRLLKVERTGEKTGTSSSVVSLIYQISQAQISYNSANGYSKISYLYNAYTYHTSFIGSNSMPNGDLLENGFQQNALYYDKLIVGNGIILYVITDPDGNIVWTGGTPPPWFYSSPELISVLINGKGNNTYWLFKSEVYNLTATVRHANLIRLNFTDTVHMIIFYYNNMTKIQRLYVYDANGTLINENVANGLSVSRLFGSNQTITLTWKFMINQNVIDSYNKSVNYSLDYYNSTTGIKLINLHGVSNLSFNIYNLGGIASYSFVGDGGHTLGGSPFELHAKNSTTNSSAFSQMIYRRLQSVHALIELNTDDKVEIGGGHFEYLINPGYYELGFDYKLNGHEEDIWIPGWSVRVYISEITVGTYGSGADSDYVKLSVLWYNHGVFVRGDQYIYANHWGYDNISRFPSNRRSITFWADLWFDKTNSSTVFGGRINSEYYGYAEDGVSWWFGYGGFRPLIGNVTASMIFGNVRDNNGDIIPSKNIGLVRVWEKVAKTASAGDANTYTVKPFQVFDLKVAQDRMDGIDTPVFIEPKQLNIGGYSIFDPLLQAFGGIGTAITGALFGMLKLGIGAIDTVLSWVGLPYGTFSSFMNLAMTVFGSLVASLYATLSMISRALTLITTFVTTVITFVDYAISIILFFGVDLFSIPIQIIALFMAVINGGTINFYGIPLDFTPYAQLMIALKTLLPPMGGIMLTIWILWGNLEMRGEPDMIGALHRINQLFGMMRDLFLNITWMFTRIRNELVSVYKFIISHIPTMGVSGGTADEGGTSGDH